MRAIAPTLSESIVSSATFERLLEMSDQLPLTTGAILECHLHDASRVDLSIRITTLDWEREALVGTHPAFHYPDVFFVHPAWERLRQFAQNWQNNGKLIHNRIRYCWLEFDTDLPNALSVPTIFFDSASFCANCSLCSMHRTARSDRRLGYEVSKPISPVPAVS